MRKISAGKAILLECDTGAYLRKHCPGPAVPAGADLKNLEFLPPVRPNLFGSTRSSGASLGSGTLPPFPEATEVQTTPRGPATRFQLKKGGKGQSALPFKPAAQLL